MTEVIGLSAFAHSDLPTAEVDRQQEVYDALADAVRGLVDATIRSTVPEERKSHRAVDELQNFIENVFEKRTSIK